MNSGCGMESALMGKGKKIITLLMGEKTFACVNSNTLSVRNIQISLHCPFDLTYLSNLLNLLGYSSFLEQLL